MIRRVGPFAILAAVLAYFALQSRPAPEPLVEERDLFDGIAYRREVRRAPRPVDLHVARIDLDRPGIELVPTPPDGDDGTFRARTTSGFLEEFGVQLAVNASFFEPFRATSPDDYYPRVGEPVTIPGRGPRVEGSADYSISNSTTYALPRPWGRARISIV